MNRALAGLLLLCVFTVPLWVDAEESTGFEARFVQERTTPGLERSFRSEGRLIWVAGERLEWRTEQPFEYAYILYPDRIVEREPDGHEREVRSEDAPWVVSLNELLVAVMSGDESAMSDLFSIDSREALDEGERLVLIPRDAMLAEQIPEIRVDKDERIRRVLIEENDGGVLDIRLHDYEGEVLALPEDATDPDS
jgi:hypothetical protein